MLATLLVSSSQAEVADRGRAPYVTDDAPLLLDRTAAHGVSSVDLLALLNLAGWCPRMQERHTVYLAS